MISDLRYVLRLLRRSPGYSLVVILVLGLGIGVNVLAFALFKALALTPLAGVADSSSLHAFVSRTHDGRQTALSYPDYQYLRDHDRSHQGLAGSLMQGFFPRGWDLAKIDRLAEAHGENLTKRQSWWNPQFQPVVCASQTDFDTFMGHEIAREIQLARQASRPLILILPVGPMGMYRWAVYFLTE